MSNVTPREDVALTLSRLRGSDSSLPGRVAGELRRAIQDRRLAPGSRLPTEPELSTNLGVSRTSLRSALRELEREHLLHRRPGHGTYVTRHADRLFRRGLDELFSTTELIESHGYTSRTRGTEIRQVPASAEVAASLNIGVGLPVIQMQRTRLADAVPVITSEVYVPVEFFRATGTDPQQLETETSLYAFLARHGLRIVLAQTEVTPCTANATLARVLDIKRGHPLLLLRQVHFDIEGSAVFLSLDYHNPDMMRFRLTRRRTQ